MGRESDGEIECRGVRWGGRVMGRGVRRGEEGRETDGERGCRGVRWGERGSVEGCGGVMWEGREMWRGCVER